MLGLPQTRKTRQIFFLAKYQLSTKVNSNNLAFEIVFLQVVWNLIYSRRTAKVRVALIILRDALILPN